MTFIPANPQVGDKVILTRDATVTVGTFTAGHEFTIKETSDMRGEYSLVDAEGRGLGVPSNYFRKK